MSWSLLKEVRFPTYFMFFVSRGNLERIMYLHYNFLQDGKSILVPKEVMDVRKRKL
jgi:hypothetical protein